MAFDLTKRTTEQACRLVYSGYLGERKKGKLVYKIPHGFIGSITMVELLKDSLKSKHNLQLASIKDYSCIFHEKDTSIVQKALDIILKPTTEKE